MDKQKTHIFDVDDTLVPCRWLKYVNAYLEKTGQKTYEQHEITSPFFFCDTVFPTPEKMQGFLDFFLQYDSYKDMKPIEGAVDCLRKLSEADRVLYSTKVVPQFKVDPEYNLRFAATEFPQKLRWLMTHFPFIPPTHMNITGQKDIIHGHSLIEDNFNYLEVNENNFKKKLLHTTHHNKGLSKQELDRIGAIRVNTFQQIEEHLLHQ